MRAGNINKHDQTIHDKIKAALKLLALRKPHVLVQFRTPRVVGTHQQLTTIDQPFGFGVTMIKHLFRIGGTLSARFMMWIRIMLKKKTLVLSCEYSGKDCQNGPQM